jgi:hypothetical protein
MGPSCRFWILAHLDERLGVHECQTEVNQNTVGKRSIRNNANELGPSFAPTCRKPEGRYANFFQIGHNAAEFLLEFGQEEGRIIHTRIYMSPQTRSDFSPISWPTR